MIISHPETPFTAFRVYFESRDPESGYLADFRSNLHLEDSKSPEVFVSSKLSRDATSRWSDTHFYDLSPTDFIKLRLEENKIVSVECGDIAPSKADTSTKVEMVNRDIKDLGVALDQNNFNPLALITSCMAKGKVVPVSVISDARV